MRIVASAEDIYVDPSALLRLYIHQQESATMSAWRRRTKGPLTVTRHGRAEITNGICLAALRGDISREGLRDTLESLHEDFVDGRYRQADLLWRATLDRAAVLSQEHTPELGTRALDVLHVASALELELPYFVTFDSRQQKLARAVGLKLITPKG